MYSLLGVPYVKIIIPAIQVPFIMGGAEIHINNLRQNLEKRGHQVEILRFPFAFFPETLVEKCIDFAAGMDLSTFNGHEIDLVIALQFPAFYVKHPRKILWLLHQYRAVYELYDRRAASRSLRRLRKKIIDYDTKYLSEGKRTFTIARNVSRRLQECNKLPSTPLYHPPLGEEHFYSEAPYDFIFYPSRIETLKRQDLLVKAMAFTRSPVVAIIAGDGGQREALQSLIESRQLQHKVKLMNFIGMNERELLYKLYARCLGAFFGPKDEDYGYVTLEAMLSCKPVITCHDSGGPLEFVVDGENGFITDPHPRAIAEKIDWLYENKEKAVEMGRRGFHTYQQKQISWDHVIDTLLGA